MRSQDSEQALRQKEAEGSAERPDFDVLKRFLNYRSSKIGSNRELLTRINHQMHKVGSKHHHKRSNSNVVAQPNITTLSELKLLKGGKEIND